MVIINQNCYQPMRQARIEQGLTQRQLGEKSGIPFYSIQDYEKGRSRPSAYRLGMIAEALGLDASGYPPPPPPRKPLPIKKRNELLEEFMDLPGYIIRDNWPLVAAAHMEVEDLKQELLLRGMQAIETYNPDGGASLRSHLNIAMQYHLMRLAKAASAKGMTHVPKGVRITFCSVEAMSENGFELEGKEREEKTWNF